MFDPIPKISNLKIFITCCIKIYCKTYSKVSIDYLSSSVVTLQRSHGN
jgi:hypothetical protein